MTGEKICYTIGLGGLGGCFVLQNELLGEETRQKNQLKKQGDK